MKSVIGEVLGQVLEAISAAAIVNREVKRIRVVRYVRPGDAYLMRGTKARCFEILIHPVDWQRLLDNHSARGGRDCYLFDIPVEEEA